MTIFNPTRSESERGVTSNVWLNNEDRSKSFIDIATLYFFEQDKNNQGIEQSKNDYLVIPYKRSQEGYDIPQYICTYSTIKHLPVTLALLKLMKEGQYEYKVFTCHIKDSDNDEYQGLPYNNDRKFIIDVTHECTRVALNYKALVEQLD